VIPSLRTLSPDGNALEGPQLLSNDRREPFGLSTSLGKQTWWIQPIILGPCPLVRRMPLTK